MITITILSIFLLTLYTNSSLGMLVGKTPADLYHESDIILIGKITISKENVEQRVTDYTISVEKYLKNDLNESTMQIRSNGCKACSPSIEDEPIFSTGDRVLLYLNKLDNAYQISPYSTILDVTDNVLPKELEDAAGYERLVPQVAVAGIIGLTVISFVIVYHKTKKGRK